MKRIAIKIDVDTYQGTLAGVPALRDLLQRHNAGATFFFSLGPDYSGCESSATSLARYYPWQSRLYGRYLPAPDIGKRGTEIMRQTAAAGFETGLHGWNRVFWERRIRQAESTWAEKDLFRACARYAEIFSEKPLAHGAPGWLTSRHALRLTQRLGLSYASDSRGCHPFIPVIDGEIIACPQLPTTLPTLDEILAVEPGYTPEQAADRIAQLATAIPGDHVATWRAEIEGAKYPGIAERFLTTMKEAGCQLVPLRDLRADLDIALLPRHSVMFRGTPGRHGERMAQGPRFLYE